MNKVIELEPRVAYITHCNRCSRMSLGEIILQFNEEKHRPLHFLGDGGKISLPFSMYRGELIFGGEIKNVFGKGKTLGRIGEKIAYSLSIEVPQRIAAFSLSGKGVRKRFVAYLDENCFSDNLRAYLNCDGKPYCAYGTFSLNVITEDFSEKGKEVDFTPAIRVVRFRQGKYNPGPI